MFKAPVTNDVAPNKNRSLREKRDAQKTALCSALCKNDLTAPDKTGDKKFIAESRMALRGLNSGTLN